MPFVGTHPRPSALDRRVVAGVAAVGVLALALLGVKFWPTGGPVVSEHGGARSDPDGGPTTGATTPEAPHTVLLEGAVQVPKLWEAVYERLRQNFTIEAREAAKSEKLGETGLREGGQFSIKVSTTDEAAPRVELAWKWSSADDFVLWPVIHPPVGPPFEGYVFKRLTDIYEQERQSIRADVGTGRFADADEGLRRLERLFDMFGNPEQVLDPGVSIGELRFKLFQEICTAAHEFRGSRGRSHVSDDVIEVEREWRKKQFAAALETEQPERALVRSLNAWADFSRESYSRRQRTWPVRPVGQLQDALELPHYDTWLREDVVSVADQLRALEEPLRDRGMTDRLGSRRREELAQVLASNAEDVRMSRLVDLLSGLTSLYRERSE